MSGWGLFPIEAHPEIVSIRSMADYDRVKHLEMISKAIERMDARASSLKMLSPAALGVALLLVDKKVPAWLALSAAALAVLIYWYQDARYLGRERAFRDLFDEVRAGSHDSDPYVMNISKIFGKQSPWKCMLVGPIIAVHGTTLLLIGIACLALSLYPRG